MLESVSPIEPKITSYAGGDNPFVLAIIILLALLGIGILLYRLVQRHQRRQAFRLHCAKKNLTSNEISTLLDYQRRFHIRDPLASIQREPQFDHLMDQVAHSVRTLKGCQDNIRREAQRARSIREKLGFRHVWEQSPLRSTRGMPEGTQLLVCFRDPDSREKLVFASEVVRNDELFLSISPMKNATDRGLLSSRRPNLEIKFFGPDGCAYTFDARFVAAVSHPRPAWQVMHRQRFSLEPPVKGPKIEALLIMGGESENVEIPVGISYLSASDCRFEQAILHEPAQAGDTCMLCFQLDGKAMTLGCHIMSRSEERPFTYMATFPHLDDERKRLILAHKTAQEAKA